MRRQQVIDEDDVVLWHNRFPLCPGSGGGLLFVLPVIAWRIDSEQCAISRTVIKPHYSFFTAPIWVLETQWATLKRRSWLVAVWPLPTLLSLSPPLYCSCFTVSLHLFRIICSHLSSLPSLLLLTFSFTLLHQTEFLALELSTAASVLLKPQSSLSFTLIVPRIFHFHALSLSFSSFLLKSQAPDWVTGL